MAVDLSHTLVVGVSASALFDLREAGRIFQERGVRAYREHMVATADQPLAPGTGFALCEALLALNGATEAEQRVEVLVMSRNTPETGARVSRSVRAHGLPITRFAFTGGESLSPYASAFGVDLFLSTSAGDVQRIIDDGVCAAAVLYPPPPGYQAPTRQVRFAFDGDAVLFSEDSELVYKRDGLPAFQASEEAAKHEPLAEGPFAHFLRKLSRLKASLPEQVEYAPIRIAVVTARNAPAEARVLTTLRAWDVYVDEAFFLGGLPKDKVLAAFRPHIFFDDQDHHLLPASSLVPSGRVPYRRGSSLSPEPAPAPTAPDGEVHVNRSPADAGRSQP